MWYTTRKGNHTIPSYDSAPLSLKNNLDDLNKMSKIWANIKYKGCKYSSSITNQIRYMEKNLN